MKINPCFLKKLNILKASAVLLALSSPQIYATDGTWNVTSGDWKWSTQGNWLSSNIADGSGATADFSHVNLTSDAIVSLDTNRTLEKIVFGDTDTATAGGWKINKSDGTKTLTLAGLNTPTITVNNLGTGKVATIYAIVAGTQGFIKEGTGTLQLGDWNPFTGDIIVNAGKIQLTAASHLDTVSQKMYSSIGNLDTNRKVIINNGASVETLTNNAFNTAVSPDASVSFQVNTGGKLSTTRFTTIGNVELNGGTLENNLVAGVDNNYDGFSFLGKITVGGQSASSITSVNGRANRLNTSTEFAVADATGNKAADLIVSAPLWNKQGGAAAALKKTGVGTMELNGANTYTGGTIVSEGTLLVTNASGSGLGTGAVNVTGGTLGGTGFIAVGTNAISIGAGATLLGGNGVDGTGTLTLTGAVNLADNSILSFVLGSDGLHSAIARAGSAAWTFDTNQAVSFIDAGAQTNTTYANLITGLASDPGVASWTITNAEWTGTFSYSNGNVSLTLDAVPEPSTYVLVGVGLALAFLHLRQNRQKIAALR